MGKILCWFPQEKPQKLFSFAELRSSPVLCRMAVILWGPDLVIILALSIPCLFLAQKLWEEALVLAFTSWFLSWTFKHQSFSLPALVQTPDSGAGPWTFQHRFLSLSWQIPWPASVDLHGTLPWNWDPGFLGSLACGETFYTVLRLTLVTLCHWAVSSSWKMTKFYLSYKLSM